MRLILGSGPYREKCAQLGDGGGDYAERAYAECRAFREQILREAQRRGITIPRSLEIQIAGQAHDFGTYYELAGVCPDRDIDACDAALALDGLEIERWDVEALVALGRGFYRDLGDEMPHGSRVFQVRATSCDGDHFLHYAVALPDETNEQVFERAVAYFDDSTVHDVEEEDVQWTE